MISPLHKVLIFTETSHHAKFRKNKTLAKISEFTVPDDTNKDILSGSVHFVRFDALHPSQQFFSHVGTISCLQEMAYI